MYNAKIIIDGVESNADSSDSVAVINEKNDFSESTLSTLLSKKAFTLDLSNEKLYVGNKKVESTKLLDICPEPIKSNDSVTTIVDEISMGRDKYYEGFEIEASYYNDTYAVFNIKGDYKKLKFKVGHIDDSDMIDATVKIFLSDQNGKINKSPNKVINIKPDELPQNMEVGLNYTKEIKFEVSAENGNPDIGFVNLYLD